MENNDPSGLDGLVVAERKWLPGRVHQLVLFEPPAKWTQDFSNLILREREGLIVWRAEIPEGDVAFLTFEVMDAQNEVLTVTMRRRAVVLDLATGLVKAVFPVLAHYGADDPS